MCEIAVVVFNSEFEFVGDRCAVARDEISDQHRGGLLGIEASKKIPRSDVPQFMDAHSFCPSLRANLSKSRPLS
jgi:hypothetical protein